jgi:hypothetical protein
MTSQQSIGRSMFAPGEEAVSVSSILRLLESRPDLVERFNDVLGRPFGRNLIPLAKTRKWIDDTQRLGRMAEFVLEGKLRHHAARMACKEDLAGANLEACERRLVREFNKRQLG